jgi:hypothetical protein
MVAKRHLIVRSAASEPLSRWPPRRLRGWYLLCLIRYVLSTSRLLCEFSFIHREAPLRYQQFVIKGERPAS